MTLRIIFQHEASDQFRKLIASPSLARVDDHPFTGGFGRAYFPVVFGDDRRDRTFAVAADDVPVAVVPCCEGDGVLDWYGHPIYIFLDAAYSPHEAVVGAALDAIERLAERASASVIRILDVEPAAQLSALGSCCLSRGWRAELAFSGTCDLALGETGLRSGLRKSYRSLVNWGRKNIALTYVNRQNPDHAAFENYREFHREIAGRATRPEASWTAMFDWIASGGGELAIGHLDTGELVTGTMVLDGARVAYYSSGVYDRARFDKPMAHFPVYDAIIRSGERGMRRFDLGEIPQPGTASPKEEAIAYFKRGFAGSINTAIEWRRTVPSEPSVP